MRLLEAGKNQFKVEKDRKISSNYTIKLMAIKEKLQDAIVLDESLGPTVRNHRDI